MDCDEIFKSNLECPMGKSVGFWWQFRSWFRSLLIVECGW